MINIHQCCDYFSVAVFVFDGRQHYLVCLTLSESETPVTSSYIGSSFVVSSVLINDSKGAFIFVLLLKIMTVTVEEITTLTIKAVVRKLIEITYVTVLVSELHVLTVTIESEICVLWFSVGPWLSLGVLSSFT